MKAIFYYKVLTKQPILNESDMEVILSGFGINKEQELRTMLVLLQSIQKKATEKLSNSYPVGKVLKLEKTNTNK